MGTTLLKSVHYFHNCPKCVELDGVAPCHPKRHCYIQNSSCFLFCFVLVPFVLSSTLHIKGIVHPKIDLLTSVEHKRHFDEQTVLVPINFHCMDEKKKKSSFMFNKRNHNIDLEQHEGIIFTFG